MRIKTGLELTQVIREIVREERSRVLQETIGNRITAPKHSRKNGREILRENEADPSRGLFAKNMSYGGYYVEDAMGEPISLGTMILHLADADDTAFFNSDDGTDPENLEKILSRHNDGVQGGVQRWDSDVFETYYGVDPVKLINRYAHSTENGPISWIGEDDDLPSDKIWREKNTQAWEDSVADDDGSYEFEEEYS